MSSSTALGDLDSLVFDNRFLRELAVDPDSTNRPRQVEGACSSRVQPRAVREPRLQAFSAEVASLLGLSEEACRSAEFAEVFGGNRLLPGMDPHAQCYGGHQFGQWAGQLGDGRAINLGEVVRGGSHFSLQLKGSGPTPYSRSGDGFAVLRSSVREFLCSEAMHHLGIPTTRALSLVTTGESIARDMFYDGHPREEPGAVVCRVSRSFIRIGSFEIFAARGDVERLRDLVEFTIRHDFPRCAALEGADRIVEWFREVCRTTAELVTHWMRVGFVHGVMNTDNLSILGETIDYGPYGWLENYDPDWTPNTTDAAGRRYCFARQPQIAHWNLLQLARAVLPLLEDATPLQEVFEEYAENYERGWSAMMTAKLGLCAGSSKDDEALVGELLEVLSLAETDMTIFFRELAEIPAAELDGEGPGRDPMAPLQDAYYVPDQLTPEVRARSAAWLEQYRGRLREDGRSDADRRARMNAVNPRYVLRNYLAQLAIDKAEEGDPSLVVELLDVLRRPYDDQPGKSEFAARRPDWARNRPGCSMLSCSS